MSREEFSDALAEVTRERDRLQAFKDWVHGFLDGKGVPHHPPGSHGAEGCRIGDRMDWVFALIDEKDRLIVAQAERIHAQSELLGKRAEKPT